MKNVPLHPVWVSGELQLVCDSWYFLQNDSKRVTHINKLFLKAPQDVNTGAAMAKNSTRVWRGAVPKIGAGVLQQQRN